VESASADHETNTATVEGETDVNLLVAAVADAGYEASARADRLAHTFDSEA
jgi:copper chaperone CopZ